MDKIDFLSKLAAEKVSLPESIVLLCVASKKTNNKDAAKITHKSDSAAHSMLSNMVNKDLINYEKLGRDNIYKLTKKGEGILLRVLK